jgi:predicted site-specific integrase-resolvase
MKLSEYAKKLGISYSTAWRLWKKGKLNAYQLPTGTVIVTDEEIATPHPVEVACIYTRVSSAENKDNLKRQSERLVSYSVARGYIQLLLNQTGRRLEIVNEAATDKDDLMSDFAAVITSFCSRLYGLRRAKRKTEKIIAELKKEKEGEEDAAS